MVDRIRWSPVRGDWMKSIHFGCKVLYWWLTSFKIENSMSEWVSEWVYRINVSRSVRLAVKCACSSKSRPALQCANSNKKLRANAYRQRRNCWGMQRVLNILAKNNSEKIRRPAQPGAFCPFDLKGHVHSRPGHLDLARVFVNEWMRSYTSVFSVFVWIMVIEPWAHDFISFVTLSSLPLTQSLGQQLTCRVRNCSSTSHQNFSTMRYKRAERSTCRH